MMKNKFIYSRTYEFEASAGHRKYYFFNLLERHGNDVSFSLRIKGNKDVISSVIAMDGDVETAAFVYKGMEFNLRANRCYGKRYSNTPEGQMQKKEDRLKDARLLASAPTGRPLITLIIDEMDESKPTFCSPYVWIVILRNREGCAVEVDFYTPEEAPEKLHNLFNDVGSFIFRTTFEAVDCLLHDIEGPEAIDAISLAIAKYFESDDEATKVDASLFDIKRDVDFEIITVWGTEVDRFTLLSNGQLEWE